MCGAPLFTVLLNLQEATNSWVMSLAFKFSMRWRDSRVKSMACQKQLEKMLSIESIEPDAYRLYKSSFNSLLWQPMMMITGTTKRRRELLYGRAGFNGSWPDASFGVPDLVLFRSEG